MKIKPIITLLIFVSIAPHLLAGDEAAELLGQMRERSIAASEEGGPRVQTETQLTGAGHEFVASGKTGSKLSRFREARGAPATDSPRTGEAPRKKPAIAPEVIQAMKQGGPSSVPVTIGGGKGMKLTIPAGTMPQRAASTVQAIRTPGPSIHSTSQAGLRAVRTTSDFAAGQAASHARHSP